ncbi:MAG: GNAT family N-acetyltransferase [Bacteroidota bacterium]
MDLRRLTPADAPAYRALALSGYAESPEAFTSTVREREPLPLAWWTERVSDAPEAASLVIGTWDADRLVGVAGLRFSTRERKRHIATLYGMFVAPEARGRGLGRRLVEAALEHLRQKPGVEVVQLTVREPNAGARRLYAVCGFEAFGVEPLAIRLGDGQFVATVHMWRRVES